MADVVRPAHSRVLGDFVIWDNLTALDFQSTVISVVVGLGGTYVLMLLILDIFVPIGRLLGRLMDDHPHTIWAYSVNVGGSLIGTWLFVMLSVMFQPPLTWFLVLGVLACFFIDWKNRGWQINALLVVGIISLAWLAGHENKPREVIWSPY